MVLCDGVHRDPGSNKFTILGTFNTLFAQNYPAQVSFWIYVAITDGIGPSTICLQLVDAKAGLIDASIDEEVDGRVFSFKTDVNFVNPMTVTETVLGVACELKEPGLYHCELWANESLLMSRRLSAELAQ